MLKLDDRLEQIAKLVRPGGRVADVGADHGFLVVSLVERGLASSGLACDINEMPLAKSRRTIERAGLSEKIRCVLSDGLADVPSDEVDDIVIAGMGGDLIARIVLETPWLRDEQKHLILQPMTKADHLREALAAGGFDTHREMAVCSGEFVYTVLSVHYTGQSRQIDELERQIGKVIQGGSPDTAQYLQRVSHSLKRRAEGLEQSSQVFAQAGEYRTLAEQINRIKEEWEHGHCVGDL